MRRGCFVSTAEGGLMIAADLSGRSVLVTGGASGIGLAAATRFAVCGVAVAINDRAENVALDEAVSALHDRGCEVVAAPGEVSDPQDGASIVKPAARAMDWLDYLLRRRRSRLQDVGHATADALRNTMAPRRWTGHLDAPCTDTKFTLPPSVGVALRYLSSNRHGPGQRSGVSLQSCRVTNQCRSYTQSLRFELRTCLLAIFPCVSQ